MIAVISMYKLFKAEICDKIIRIYIICICHNIITSKLKEQSAKILLLPRPPKYEIIIVPSIHSNFQYCDSNIGLFSIAHCKVVTLNPLCSLFGISS